MKGIIDLIHSKGKTVTAAAKACDITSASLYNYDKGTDMGLKTARKLSEFLEVEMDDIYLVTKNTQI